MVLNFNILYSFHEISNKSYIQDFETSTFIQQSVCQIRYIRLKSSFRKVWVKSGLLAQNLHSNCESSELY